VTWSAEVIVSLKPVVNDPQGLVVRDGLRRLGFDGVRSARVGKHIVLEVEAEDEPSARELVSRMCETLLRNPVIEDHRISSLRRLEEGSLT
jgi:phosphoribosylformylglycinamidine synthase PurS subunit